MTVLLVVALGVVLAWPRRPRPAGGPAPPPLPLGRVAPAAGLVLTGLALGPTVPALALGARWAWRRLGRQRAATRRHAEVADALPEVADLLALCIAGGLTVPLALRAVSGWVTGPLGGALREAVHRLELGVPTAEVLAGLPGRAGDGVGPVVAVLVASERYGVPLGEGLDRVAREARLERRRRAEERARRVPVLLLFPLVCCVLPAFGLLTVVPLLAGSLPPLPA